MKPIFLFSFIMFSCWLGKPKISNWALDRGLKIEWALIPIFDVGYLRVQHKIRFLIDILKGSWIRFEGSMVLKHWIELEINKDKH